MLSIPYLRAPVFREGDTLRYEQREVPVQTVLQDRLIDLVFEARADLALLAEEVVRAGAAATMVEATAKLRRAFADPESLIGLIELDIDASYDVILVEQGYGGVYVHSVELLKQLQRERRCLLIAPIRPLFGDEEVTARVTLDDLRTQVPDLSYFSYVNIVRALVRLVPCKLLLIAHRSQSLFLFDLVRERPTIIYCDGFFDGLFRMSMDLRFRGGERARKRVLSEVYYLIGNQGDFCGIPDMPTMNRYLLMAGYRSLRDARENWCWGMRQTRDFRAAFPRLRRPARFMPPFTDPELFRRELVAREKVVLFTTTMHNIELKGFPELVKAMQRLRSLRVRCVVRQPHCLPKYPKSLEPRFEMGGVTKPEMIRLYHRVWLNCRVSREESSPVSILEAMVCEVPQVISPVVAEQIPILEDGKTGFVVHPDDTPALVHALRTLLHDRKLRDEMGAECRRRALRYSFSERARAFAPYFA